MTCDFRHDDGAYVLGALSPTERQQFEQHLRECPECAESVRRIAGLPGLLARVPADVLDPPVDEEPVPDTLLPSLIREVRRAGHRRRLVLSSLAAAAAIVVGALFLVGSGGLPWADSPRAPAVVAGPPAADRPMTAVDQESVRGSIGFQDVAWGTKVALACTYAAPGSEYSVPSSTTYALVVRARDGHAEQVATWRALPGRTMQISAATALPRRDIRSVEVRTADGRPVLQWGL